MEDPYFICFGCWNNGGCGAEPKNELTKVMDSLREMTPTQIVIAGDNYYPEKIKDKINKKNTKRIFKRGELKSGFECLPQGIPIYINYGNHDYETELNIDGAEEKEYDCTLLKNELDVVSELNEIGYQIQLNIYNKFKFSEKTLVILLDTTIYDPDDFKDSLGCYNKVLNPEYTNIDTIKSDQDEFIRAKIGEEEENIRNKTIKNIVIVGHHPIIQYKEKDDNINLMSLPELADTLYSKIFEPINSINSMNTMNTNMNYYYMCADLHQYQTGEVTISKTEGSKMKIRQYIIGTGGAKKDNYNKEKIKNKIESEFENEIPFQRDEDIKIEYNMSEEDLTSSMSENGFLVCSDREDGLECIFKSIKEETGVGIGGKKRKTIKRRRKTIKRRRKTIKRKKGSFKKRKTTRKRSNTYKKYRIRN